MSKNRVKMDICGIQCSLITEESTEYMEGLGREVAERIEAFLKASSLAGIDLAAVTTALSFCDESHKLRESLVDKEDGGELKRLEQECLNKLNGLRESQEHNILKLKESHAAELNELKIAHGLALEDLMNDCVRETEGLKASGEESLKKLEESHRAQLEQLEAAHTRELEVRLGEKSESADNDSALLKDELEDMRFMHEDEIKELQKMQRDEIERLKELHRAECDSISAAHRNECEELKLRAESDGLIISTIQEKLLEYEKELEILKKQKPAETPQSLSEKPEPETQPKMRKQLKNPLKQEMEQQGLISFFEKGC